MRGGIHLNSGFRPNRETPIATHRATERKGLEGKYVHPVRLPGVSVYVPLRLAVWKDTAVSGIVGTSAGGGVTHEDQ